MNGEAIGTANEDMDVCDTGSPVNHKENSTEEKPGTPAPPETNVKEDNNQDVLLSVKDTNLSEESEKHVSTEPESETTEKEILPEKSDADTEHTNKQNITCENNAGNTNGNDTNKDEGSKQKSEAKVQAKNEKNLITDRVIDIHFEESDEIDSEEDSSEDESERLPQPADTVSIHSDSDSNASQEVRYTNKNAIIILDNEVRGQSGNDSSCDALSPEIHEILSDNDDDCVVTKDDKSEKETLRRSRRGVKRKTYDDNEEVNGDDDESDVEEVVLEDPLKKQLKPILISDTRSLVNMAVKQTKTNQGNLKKGSSIAIGSNISIKAVSGKNSQTSNSTKGNAKSGNSATSQPIILPSLTDDMFVVEAPSFIVPYVYEKPSVKPFREFVDILGRELDEQKLKEEKERLEKEKEEKEKREKDRQERRERGEEVSDTDDEKTKEDEAKKKKEQKRERRRRKKEDDDASWDGESSSDSEDEILSDEEDKVVALKNKLLAINELKDDDQLTAGKLISAKSDNYFDCSLGKFFMNIGLNLVQEFVQTDLLKQQNRKLYREKKAGHSTKSTESSIASLRSNLNFSKENNAPYEFKQKKCEFCSFKTESSLVMSNHLETPHMKNNMYKCNYCSFEIRSPHDILFHMEAEHNVRGKLERAPAYHQCANCPFEDNGKGKLARHLIPCSKKYKPEVNLAPPVEWEPPAKIPKITRARNNNTSPYSTVGRSQPTGVSISRAPLLNAGPPVVFKTRVRGPAISNIRGTAPGPAILRGGVTVRPAPASGLMPSNFGIVNNGKTSKNHQPSISITPLPRQPQPSLQIQAAGRSHLQGGKASFVICEICDGYIKDLEQLRNHMQWIHKVKIHPKMIHNRPPLNCQKCQFRFFTDQGLERHLLGSHGLVTSSMQEAANKGKDAGRCPVCGRVYQWKLLAHVARDHNLTLKPAHLSYKCTVCTATFGMYKQFESHVYSAHSVVAKRVVEKGEVPSQSKTSTNNSVLKPMKINDEITIIPQPAKSTASKTK